VRATGGRGKGYEATDTTKVSEEVSTVTQKLTAARRRALREEAEEWDQLSDEDWARLFDEGKPVHIRLRRPQMTDETGPRK